MLDGSYPWHRTQEHRPSTCRSSGTSERAAASRIQPDIPQEATPEEEPFEIKLVVPESATAQDSPAEGKQPEDPGTEDKTDEEQLPPSDTESEKLY
jgi:hypothetical protein